MPSINLVSRVSGLALHLWEIKEDLSFFMKDILLTTNEDLEYESLMGKRQLEFIVQRYLLNKNLKGDKPLLRKMKNGKPFLINRDEKISISHSKNMLVLSIASRDHGVDLEWVDQRITRLASKFCNPSELIVPEYTNDVFWYTLVWSCKESLYKVDGLGQLEFRTQLAVHFTPDSFENGWGRGIIRRNEEELFFRIYFEYINGFIVSWVYPSGS